MRGAMVPWPGGGIGTVRVAAVKKVIGIISAHTQLRSPTGLWEECLFRGSKAAFDARRDYLRYQKPAAPNLT